MSETVRQWTQEQYKVYTIKKGNKKRQIEEPRKELKEIQKSLIENFGGFPFHQSCHSVKTKSISTNAEAHRWAKFVLQIDIRQCYQTTTEDKIIKSYVKSVFLTEPANKALMDTLDYCMWFDKYRGTWRLPTGAPTSPILCNMALTEIDNEIYPLMNKQGYVYTRYMDDITISTTKPERDWSIKDQVEAIVKSKGYQINKEKSKWATRGKEPVIITGVKLNHHNKVPYKFYKMMRARLNNLAKAEKPIDEETRGCLGYIYSIDPHIHSYLLKYYEKRLNGAVK